MENIKCLECGESFVHGKRKSSYCSKVCGLRAYHKRKRLEQAGNDNSNIAPNKKADRFSCDETGQWWYLFGTRRTRTRVYPQDCPECGKRWIPAYRSNMQRAVHCSKSCALKAMHKANPGIHSGAKSGRWKGGRQIDQHGYVMVWAPDHHSNANNKRIYVQEHRLIMEAMLGRHLKRGEQVHHKNGIRDDNRPENLELWTHSQPAGVRKGDELHCPTCTCFAHAKH